MKDITTYNFPKITTLDLAFATIDVPQFLLKESKERGFYNGKTKANELFNKWFFSGLDNPPSFKENIDRDKCEKAIGFCVCLMGSFAPKHEEKEAVCSLIMNDFLEI